MTLKISGAGKLTSGVCSYPKTSLRDRGHRTPGAVRDILPFNGLKNISLKGNQSEGTAVMRKPIKTLITTTKSNMQTNTIPLVFYTSKISNNGYNTITIHL